MASDDEFAIRDEPAALPGWDSSQAGSPAEVLERDLRALMRQLADARLSLDEERHRGRDEMTRLLVGALEIQDAFDRVFRSIHEKEDQVTKQMKIWISNFRTVRKLLDKLLTERGVTPIENLDQGFDPVWHRVVETVSDPTRADGTIVREEKRGYLWGGAILRKAEVVVVRNDGTAGHDDEH